MYATQPISHALPPRPDFDHFVPQSTPSPIVNPASRSPFALYHPLAADTTVYYSFCVPCTILTGPDRDDIIYLTAGAEKWLEHQHPSPGYTRYSPAYDAIISDLEQTCRRITETDEKACQAYVVVSDKSQAIYPSDRKRRPFVLGVRLIACDIIMAMRMRGIILRACPVALRTACVDLDKHQYTEAIGKHLNHIATHTGADIFVLRPHESKAEAAGDPEVDASQGTRLKIKIYGDHESVEHAKFRVLILIDDLLGQKVHSLYIELSLHSLICGRGRKNVKLIESTTNTAIYFPPIFPHLYGYTPKGAQRRHPNQVFITGNETNIAKADHLLNTMATSNRAFVKDVALQCIKIDYLLLERLDELKKIAELNGAFVQFPQLGATHNGLRVQGLEMLHIERTVRSIMAIAGQYYQATWWITPEPPAGLGLTRNEIEQVITDVSTSTGVDISYRRSSFDIMGSDEAVKRALGILKDKDCLKSRPHRIHIKIELANEHKEFVAGKKNGKINKIMSQASIQIIFDGFNDYNFYIDVCGIDYASTIAGLKLVEQELPAAMSFHVPDTYHKRIIGVGGQHIQTIMKKYSVFVKFSNAMERGVTGRMDNEDMKVDNVICRTPARNAANLEAVKEEIMEMVQQVDAEIVTENVEIPRLHHRALIAQRTRLERLEIKWGCNISFPSTEMASDLVTIKGPEWQIPHFKEEFLALVPETHHIKMKWNSEMERILCEPRFQTNVVEPMKNQFGMDIEVLGFPLENNDTEVKTIQFSYTRNNAGGLQDAIELLTNHFLSCGQKAELIKGRLSRPKSDSFEDFAPFFPSAVLPKTSSQEDLHRPGSRLSIDMSVLGDRNPSIDSTGLGDGSEMRDAFYNGDRRHRRSSVPEGHPPGSAGSGSSSSHASYHSRAGSLDSDWEKLSASRV